MTTKPRNQTVKNDDEAVPATVEAPSPPASRPSLLSSLFNGLDEAFVEASGRVDALEAELVEARRDLAAVRALKAIRAGDEMPLIGGSGSSAPARQIAARKPRQTVAGTVGQEPRGDIPKAVQALLDASHKPMSRGDIIAALQLVDDKKGGTAVSNYLASRKKKGLLIHLEDGTYRNNA